MEYAENGPNGGHPSEAIAMVSAEERYRSLVDAIRDYAIFLLDPTGHVASWNAGAERIKGYRADEIIGQHFSVFYPSDAQQRGYPAEELARAVTLGRWEDEGWRIRRDGSRFWANVVITPLRDREGMLVGFAKVTRDLTERRSNEERLRQSEERLRLLMDAVEDAVFMLDPDGHITSWNAGAKRLKGFEPAEIIGHHVSRFYPAEDIAARKPERELATAAAQGRVEDEGWRLHKDGSRFWANVVITAVYGPAGKLLGFAKVTRDMTERNRLKQLEYASELASRIETAREEEKKRISRELHDDLGQQLTALKMGLNRLVTQDDATPSAQAAQLADSMRAALDRAILSVRRLSAGLRPAILDDLGLLPALEWLVDDFRQRSGLRVLFHTERCDVRFTGRRVDGVVPHRPGGAHEHCAARMESDRSPDRISLHGIAMRPVDRGRRRAGPVNRAPAGCGSLVGARRHSRSRATARRHERRGAFTVAGLRHQSVGPAQIGHDRLRPTAQRRRAVLQDVEIEPAATTDPIERHIPQ